MAISRIKKEETITRFSELFEKSKIVVFINFQGMKVVDVSALRRVVREKGGAVQVLKKTLIHRVFAAKSLPLEVLAYEGEIEAIFGFDDEVSVVKILDGIAKEKQRPEFRGAVMGSVLLSAQELKELAQLPSREELLAKAVGSIASPMSGFVNVCAGTMRSLIYALQAIQNNK